MASHQIVGRLAAAERADFKTYGDDLGLDLAGLLTLLWLRELRVDRLPLLASRHPEPSSVLDDKVVARLGSAEQKALVVAHATRHGMSTSKACATLVRAEVAEGWLEKAIRLDQSRVGSD